MSCTTAPSLTVQTVHVDTPEAFSTAREANEHTHLLSRGRVFRRHSYDSQPRRNSGVYSSEAVFVKVDLFLSELERRLDRIEKYRQEQLNHIDVKLRQGYNALRDVRDSCSYASGELLWGAARARATILVDTIESRYNDVIPTKESLEQKAQASMRLMESYLSQLEARVQEKQNNISAAFGEGRSRLNTLSLQTRELIDEGIDKAIKAKEALSESVSAALTRAAETRLITYDDLPIPWRVNPHIKSGYRFTNRKIECITSVFQLSNEMVNIWSHLIGLFVVLAIAFHFYPESAVFTSSTKWDILIAACFFAAACKCLICSCMWHTMNSIADNVLLERFACVDYTGISFLIAASILSTEWTAFYCEPVSRAVYMSLTATLGVLGVILPWNPTFNRMDMAWARVAFYVSLALTGFAPVIQLNLTRGPAWSFYFYAPIAKSILVYFFGAIIYASQVPEKWWPGLFDYAGGSHNIWHLAVLGGILFHYTAMMHFFNGAFRRAAQEGCSWR